MIQNSKRIIPTNEEISILKAKISNIKDINIYPPQKYVDPFIKRHPQSTKRRSASTCMSFNASKEKEIILNENKSKIMSINTNITQKQNDKNDTNMKSNYLEELLGLIPPSSSTKGKKEIIYKNTQESISFRNKKPHEDSMKIMNSKNSFEKETKRKSVQYSPFIINDEEEKKPIEKYYNSQTIEEILKDYSKLKAESITLKKSLEDNAKHILNIEKENKFLKDLYNNVPINKNSLKYFVVNLMCNNLNLDESDNRKIISELFTTDGIKSKFDFVRFLNQRIDALELQNFHLISIIEKNHISMKNYITELNEFYEVISDIRNVVNQVYESQALTTEFMIIRDTLNNKINYLNEQKQVNIAEKQRIEKDETKNLNLNMLLCKDKIVESKVYISNYGSNLKISGLNVSTYSNNNNNKLLELLDEKIEIYENLKNNIAQYEDNITRSKEEAGENANLNLNMTENLMNENYLLKTKNIRLIKFLYSLLRNGEVELSEDNISELNEVMNSNKDLVFSEDMFNIIKSQAAMIENFMEGQ